jgi:hypothetical protein
VAGSIAIGYAVCLAFVADIDHVRFARSIEMCKSGHNLSLQRALIITAARQWFRRAHAATISLSSRFRIPFAAFFSQWAVVNQATV